MFVRVRFIHSKAAALVGVLSLAACGLGKSAPPWEREGGQFQNQPGGNSQTPAIDVQPQAPEPPRVDYASVPTSICAKEIALRGTAQAGTNILVRGGNNDSQIRTTQGDGSFCIPVELNPNQPNDFEVHAQNAYGFSDPTTVTINHSCADGGQGPGTVGGAAPPTQPQTPTNVASGALVTSKYEPVKGSQNLLVDGDVANTVEWDSHDWGWNPLCVTWLTNPTNTIFNPVYVWDGWVKITLDNMADIDRIVLHWRDTAASREKTYGWLYKILVSSSPDDPGEPADNSNKWTEAFTQHDGQGGVETFRFGSSLSLIRHVAIMMQLDGKCLTWNIGEIFSGNNSFLNEHFALNEVEVFAAPPESPTRPQPTDACLQGRSSEFGGSQSPF